jgi:amidase
VQLIGAPGADATILALGRAYHAATDWPGQRPPPDP